MGYQPPDTIWTEAKRAQLRELWPTGLSTAKIGERLGCSKNAVIGRARREGLAQRAAPIQPGVKAAAAERFEWGKALLLAGFSTQRAAATAGVDRKRLEKFRDEQGLPVLFNRTTNPGSRKSARPPAEPAVDNVVPFVSPRPEPAPAPPKVQPVAERSKYQCLFLEGDEKPWVACTERAVFGYPYCERHCRDAYVGWPARKTA
jgi:GcrA cell cycle regulator